MNSTNSTTTSSGSDPVVIPWTAIWVTLLVSALQGVVFYAFFLYQRGKDKGRYSVVKSETDPMNSSTVDPVATDEDISTRVRVFDLYEPRQNTRSHRSPPPFGTSWWRDALAVSDEETLRCVGLDTFMYLRLLRLGARISGLGTFMALFLVPIYSTGKARGKATEQFNLLTLARVEQGSSWRLYIAILAWWLFCAAVLREFWKEWELFYKNRTDFAARGDADTPLHARYAIRVEQVSQISNFDGAIRRYFERLFPGKVLQTATVFQTAPLEKLIAERQKNILKLEAVEAAAHAKPDKPPAHIKVKRVKVDAAAHYQSEITRLNHEIDVARTMLVKNARLKRNSSTLSSSPSPPPPPAKSIKAAAPTVLEAPSDGGGGVKHQSIEVDVLDIGATPSNRSQADHSNSNTKAAPAVDDPSYPEDEVLPDEEAKIQSTTAFVTFTSLRAKQAAIQCELTGNPDSMVVFPAADYDSGTLWKNVAVPLPRQTVLQFQAAVFFTAGILFWTIPMAVVSFASSLNSILKAVGLKEANPSAFWYGLVTGLLPVIALAVLMYVLYLVITLAATSFIRYKSWVEVDSYCFFWHMLFQFANLWFLLIGGSVFNQIDSIISEFKLKPVADLLATALPGASVLFVNMITVSSFGAFGLQLSMIPTHAVNLILNMISPEAARTQRKLDDGRTPPSLVWGQQIPPTIFIFLVTFLYSTWSRADFISVVSSAITVNRRIVRSHQFYLPLYRQCRLFLLLRFLDSSTFPAVIWCGSTNACTSTRKRMMVAALQHGKAFLVSSWRVSIRANLSFWRT